MCSDSKTLRLPSTFVKLNQEVIFGVCLWCIDGVVLLFNKTEVPFSPDFSSLPSPRSEVPVREDKLTFEGVVEIWALLQMPSPTY